MRLNPCYLLKSFLLQKIMIRVQMMNLIFLMLFFQSKEIKENAARYVKEITDVLAFVNRQMILIFKTNDLLRNIEFSLGTQNSMSSLVQMSRACMKVLRAEERKNCQNKWCLFKSSIGGQWDQLKISFYQLFLIIYWSRLGNWIFGRA